MAKVEKFHFVDGELKQKVENTKGKYKGHKGLALTDDEKFAIDRASKFRSDLLDKTMAKDSGSVEDVTKQKQQYFNDAVEQNPNIRFELREALKLPMKYYAGGTVPRSARRY